MTRGGPPGTYGRRSVAGEEEHGRGLRVVDVGQEHSKRGTALRSLLYPGLAAVHGRKVGHQRQADAGPGCVGRDAWSLPERLEDRLTHLGRHAGSGVLDDDERAPLT